MTVPQCCLRVAAMLLDAGFLESLAPPGQRDVTATATLPQLAFQRAPSEFGFVLCALSHGLFFRAARGLVGISRRSSPLLGRGGDTTAELCPLECAL